MISVHEIKHSIARWVAMFFIALGVTGMLAFGTATLVQTSAQPPDRRAEERQAAALEGIEAELRGLRADLRRARR
jgi:choline-glycine betaine transporter